MIKGSFEIDNVKDGSGAYDIYEYEFDNSNTTLTEDKFKIKIRNVGRKVSTPDRENLIKIGTSTRFRRNKKNYAFTSESTITRDYYYNPTTDEYFAEKTSKSELFGKPKPRLIELPLSWYKI